SPVRRFLYITPKNLQTRSTMHGLRLFSYLQLLDLLTTLACLVHGLTEANPLVRASFNIGPSPLIGFAALKSLAIGMAFYCVRSHRLALLGRMNYFFAGVVIWNLLALIARS